jgi:hypothetical protein
MPQGFGRGFAGRAGFAETDCVLGEVRLRLDLAAR